MSVYVKARFKSWKSWIFWAVCAFSRSLQSDITKEIAAIKNCKISGWQNTMSSYILAKFQVFLQNYLVHQVQMFKDKWNCYALSILSDYILIAWSGNERHMFAIYIYWILMIYDPALKSLWWHYFDDFLSCIL